MRRSPGLAAARGWLPRASAPPAFGPGDVVYGAPRFGNVSAGERDEKKSECAPDAPGRVRRVVGARAVEYAAVARLPADITAANRTLPRSPRTLHLMALPNKTKIPVGTVLAGKYRITREIGRGGMAAVYEAENVDIGKRVAIKVLAQELTTSAIVVERFLREARAAAAIRSPYICDVYDSGKLEDGRPFLVLELLEGDSLYERMTKIRLIPVDTTLAIIAQTCRGLTKAHAASIVHRDLKPENIFLTKDEEGKLLAKILDFGLAKFYAPMSGSPQQARLTREGAVFGTPAYMSPEQVRGQGAVDLRADLWALACIVYECFTGRTVWSTEQGVAMTFAQIASAPLPRPGQYRPDLPESFTAWFDQALDRNIEKRFQTAKEFAEALGAALAPGRSSISLVSPSSLMNEMTPAPGTANPFLSGGSSAFGVEQKAPDADAFEKTRQFVTGGVGIGQDPPSQPGGPPASPHASTLSFSGPRGPEIPVPAAEPPSRAKQFGKIALAIGVLGAVSAGAYVGVTQLKDAPKPPQTSPSALPIASVAPPIDPSSARPTPTAPVLAPWMRQVQEAQQAIAAGDLKGAAKLLKDSFDKGGHGAPRTMLDHLNVAIAGLSDAKASCRMTGLARPRAYDLGSTQPVKPIAAGRPDITYGAQGAVMTWTDAHEGTEHAYTVVLDDALRDKLDPVDVTPEGAQVTKPELTRSGEDLVLSYTDSRGNEPGGHARFLDAGGRIKGPLVAISSTPRPNTSAPAIAQAPDGSSYAVWSEDSAGDSEDLFLRRLSPTLEGQGDPLRVTDLVPAGPSRPRARIPSLAIDSTGIVLAYRVERDPVRSVYAMHLPLGEMKGFDAPKKGAPRADRAIAETTLINTDKSKADGPSLVCGGGSCFLAWFTEGTGGATAARVDPGKASPLWRNKFSRTGTHPAVAVSATGQGQVVWFEGGKVMTAAISRDTVGPPSRIARISGDQPMPSIAAGSKPGEWYLAWLDYETGHLEAFAARVLCK
jgi:serine/threonine protein kinase